MKKLLSIILTLTFCLAAFSAIVTIASAADATISESEAKELIVKAEEFCRNVRGGYAHIHENSDEYRIDVDYGGKYPEHYYIKLPLHRQVVSEFVSMNPSLRFMLRTKKRLHTLK